jgi:hypothetical protein
MPAWGYITIALAVLIIFCLVFLLVMIEIGMKGLGAFFGLGRHVGRSLIKSWKKAEELEVNVISQIVSHDPKLEVLRAKALFQGEFKGRLPFLKFFKKDVHAYVIYPVDVRYYVPFQKKAHFEKLDDVTYDGLDKVALQIADIEVDISEPSLIDSKLFIDIESGKISKDERREILEKCWKAIDSGVKSKGLPQSIEQNRSVARNLASGVISEMLKGFGIRQPMEIEFYDLKNNEPVNISTRDKFLESIEQTYELHENDFEN